MKTTKQIHYFNVTNHNKKYFQQNIYEGKLFSHDFNGSQVAPSVFVYCCYKMLVVEPVILVLVTIILILEETSYKFIVSQCFQISRENV